MLSTGGGQLIVYPNPASTALHIEYHPTASGEVSLPLRDVTGREVQRWGFSVQAGQVHSQTLSLAGLARGLYMLHLIHGNTLWNHHIQVE